MYKCEGVAYINYFEILLLFFLFLKIDGCPVSYKFIILRILYLRLFEIEKLYVSTLENCKFVYHKLELLKIYM